MSALHFVGQVDYDVVAQKDGYRAVASAACLKLDAGYLSRANTFTADFSADDERAALAAAIEGAAQAAMTWCERENTGGLLQ